MIPNVDLYAVAKLCLAAGMIFATAALIAVIIAVGYFVVRGASSSKGKDKS